MNLKSLYTHFILVMTILLKTSCGSSAGDIDPNSLNPPNPPPISNKFPYPLSSQLNCPKGTQVSFENFGKGFMERFCLACHSQAVNGAANRRGGAPDEINFDQAQDVQRFRAMILARINTSGPLSMPPNRELPPDQKAIMNDWLNCGAPSANKEKN